MAPGQVILLQNVVKSILTATQEYTKGTTAPRLHLFVRKLGSGKLIGLAKVREGLEVEGLLTCAFCFNAVNVAAAHGSKQAKGPGQGSISKLYQQGLAQHLKGRGRMSFRPVWDT